jgi:acetate kinase
MAWSLPVALVKTQAHSRAGGGASESLGIILDEAKTALPGSAGERVISTDSSRVACAVIPTNEEKMIALDALRLGKVTSAAAYA